MDRNKKNKLDLIVLFAVFIMVFIISFIAGLYFSENGINSKKEAFKQGLNLYCKDTIINKNTYWKIDNNYFYNKENGKFFYINDCDR